MIELTINLIHKFELILFMAVDFIDETMFKTYFYKKNRHKAQRKAKFYINKCRSASCMQSGWKRTSA